MKKVCLALMFLGFIGCVSAHLKTSSGLEVDYFRRGDQNLQDFYIKTPDGFEVGLKKQSAQGENASETLKAATEFYKNIKE